MSSDLLKTLTVSLSSSFCTALFVVACTAGAEKPSETSTDDGEWGSDADDDGGSDVGGSGGDDVPSDDGDEEDAVSAAELAELAGQIEDLVAFQASALCFIGHMTDGQSYLGVAETIESYPGRWVALDWDHDGTVDYPDSGSGYDGDRGWHYWRQGPNSDAMKAYEDCF